MRHYLPVAILLTLYLGIVQQVILTGAPDRTPPSPVPMPPPIADLAMECQYGTVQQAGRLLSIEGPVWKAAGEIRKDGSVFLLWTEKASGRVAPSVYPAMGKEANGLRFLTGRWGWSDEVAIDENGKLNGDGRADHLREVVVEVPLM